MDDRGIDCEQVRAADHHGNRGVRGWTAIDAVTESRTGDGVILRACEMEASEIRESDREASSARQHNKNSFVARASNLLEHCGEFEAIIRKKFSGNRNARGAS